MEADLSRLPTGMSGWRALVDYAVSLGDLSEVDWFELKGTLSFTEKSGRKHSAATVSRAILGMSNRMPDSAQRHLGGYGVVLVGIEGQRVVGAEQVDGAELRDAIQPYVGEDGPIWDHQFIDHSDGLVLAFVIDPPQWGDPIYACRKDYTNLPVRDGDIFVRLPGKTRPASSHDLSQLDLRRSQAPHTGAKVTIDYDGTFDRVDIESFQGLVESDVDEKADNLLEGTPAAYPVSHPLASSMQAVLAQTFQQSDQRSPEEFRTEVEEWRDHSKGHSTWVAHELLRHHLARGRLVVRNESVRYLEAVRILVAFPAGVVVLMASDTSYCDHGGPFQTLKLLPDPPPRYGELGQFARPYFSQFEPNLNTAVSPYEVEETTDGYVLTWHLDDLRSNGRERSSETFAVISDHEATEIVARWSMTARGVHHEFQGELRLECEQAPNHYLMWPGHDRN